METKAGDPGAFRHFELDRVSSPAFVVDAAKLRANCQILAEVRDEAGIRMLSALKAFSMFSTAPLLGEYLDGVCTSGLWEARLASELGGQLGPALRREEGVGGVQEPDEGRASNRGHGERA